jgi:hypothetical protein
MTKTGKLIFKLLLFISIALTLTCGGQKITVANTVYN